MLTFRVSVMVWERIVAIDPRLWFKSRSKRDLVALRAALRAVRKAERERRAANRRTAVLILPADPRLLYWLERFVAHCAFKRQVRRAALRLLRRIEESPPNSALAFSLHQRYFAASSDHELRELQLRLCNLGYRVYPGIPRPWRDPEGCLDQIPWLLQVASEDGWLSGHLKAQLDAERGRGLL